METYCLQPVASTINTLAGALYKVFCSSPDQARNEMRQACFDYLSIGGFFSNGPVALLSGLNPRPLSLVLHFFSVAIYGVGRLLLPFPSPKRAWLGARLITVRTPFLWNYWTNYSSSKHYQKIENNITIMSSFFGLTGCSKYNISYCKSWRS